MAAQGELMGFGIGASPGGFHNDNNLVGSQNLSAGTPTLEEMLNQATDLQTGRTFNGTRLELKSDEMTSPFQAPPQMSPAPPAAVPSPMPMASQNYGNSQQQSFPTGSCTRIRLHSSFILSGFIHYL